MRKTFAVAVFALLATVLPFAAKADAWPIGRDGCTPGYWKNHTEDWQRFSPTTTLGEFFTFPAELSHFADDTFLDALDYGGGNTLDGATEILMRAAVAAMLNMAHHDVDYPLRPYSQPGNVQKMVNDALATLDRDTIIRTGSYLDKRNNLGCPL